MTVTPTVLLGAAVLLLALSCMTMIAEQDRQRKRVAGLEEKLRGLAA